MSYSVVRKQRESTRGTALEKERRRTFEISSTSLFVPNLLYLLLGVLLTKRS